MLKKIFSLHQKLIEENQNQKQESIAERTTLRREGIAEVKRKEENINNLIFKY